MNNWTAFISAAGLGGIFGSVITSLLQSWLSRKAALDERRFQEKKDAYVGLLQSLHDSEIEGTESAAKRVGYWRNICDLTGCEEVRHAIVDLFKTNPLQDGSVHPDRPRAFAKLKSAMRADLGIERDDLT